MSEPSLFVVPPVSRSEPGPSGPGMCEGVFVEFSKTSTSWRSPRERDRRKARAKAAERERGPSVQEQGVPPLVPKPLTEGWVDVLHHTPLAVEGVEVLRQALRFAFESGDAGGLLELVVEEGKLAPSEFDPDTFSDGLFLRELLSEAFPIVIDEQRFQPSLGHLERVLTHPPIDARDVALRQGVLRELESNAELRGSVERVYLSLRRLRTLLDERAMLPDETVRRKIDVLTTLKTFLDESAALANSTSALRRIVELGESVRGSGVVQRLEQILDFESNLATVEVRLVLAADGKIRDFELLRAKENTLNPHVRSAWSRFFTRLRAWIRGYRYGENEVLLKVIDEVFEDLEDLVLPCFRLVGQLEVYLAALGFRTVARQQGLQTCLAEMSSDKPAAMKRLFNPLLFLQRVPPVPCDLAPKHPDGLVLVTGPNSGGKTRLLQAIGIAQLLGQGGFYVPAASARLVPAPGMFLSLIETGRADQSEGRLGTELRRVRRLFETLRPGALVILDELCSGTNPGEGIAIFELVLSLLPRARPQVFLTTHFLDAARALEQDALVERLEFLQVELDGETPTYQFVPGVAPTSLASQVASRLGVTREELEKLLDARLTPEE